MGIYTLSYVFYGCPITPSVEKLNNKLKNISEEEKEIMSISVDKNYLRSSDAVFLIVPRTKIQVTCEIDARDVANGYVKMSDLESITTIQKADITPTADELELFSKYINVLVKDDKRNEANAKIGVYMAEFTWCTLNGVSSSGSDMSLSKSLLINMDK